VVYLPEGESQELSLLFMHYLIKSRRHQVIYLGQNASLTDLQDACSIHKPDFIFTMISETYAKQPVQKYVDKISSLFPKTSILLSGYQVVAQDVPSSGNVRVLHSLDETLQFLDRLKPQKETEKVFQNNNRQTA
jgi:hypothetical protein